MNRIEFDDTIAVARSRCRCHPLRLGPKQIGQRRGQDILLVDPAGRLHQVGDGIDERDPSAVVDGRRGGRVVIVKLIPPRKMVCIVWLEAL